MLTVAKLRFNRVVCCLNRENTIKDKYIFLFGKKKIDLVRLPFLFYDHYSFFFRFVDSVFLIVLFFYFNSTIFEGFEWRDSTRNPLSSLFVQSDNTHLFNTKYLSIQIIFFGDKNEIQQNTQLFTLSMRTSRIRMLG